MYEWTCDQRARRARGRVRILLGYPSAPQSLTLTLTLTGHYHVCQSFRASPSFNSAVTSDSMPTHESSSTVLAGRSTVKRTTPTPAATKAAASDYERPA